MNDKNEKTACEFALMVNIVCSEMSKVSESRAVKHVSKCNLCESKDTQ